MIQLGGYDNALLACLVNAHHGRRYVFGVSTKPDILILRRSAGCLRAHDKGQKYDGGIQSLQSHGTMGGSTNGPRIQDTEIAFWEIRRTHAVMEGASE
jgi:hypothetical protein